MKIDATLHGADIVGVIAEASAADHGPYDGIWMPEISADPFLALTIAAEHTRRVSIGTSIAVAFARNPMSLAYTADGLQRYSRGRFVLGLGSQVRAHIERRFSMPWSEPAARMQEYVSALRAIWRCWQEGTPLDFCGDFYTHTLMAPFFSPGPNPFGPPEVYLAAVGPGIAKVAASVCDGLIVHPFSTARYVREVLRPAAGDASFSLSALVASARTEEAMAAAIAGVRNQIAFYGSTPAYRAVLELHGWADAADELYRLSRSDDPQRWSAMGSVVDDDMLHALAVVAQPAEMADALVHRFGGLVDRLGFYTPYPTDPELWNEIASEIRA